MASDSEDEAGRVFAAPRQSSFLLGIDTFVKESDFRQIVSTLRDTLSLDPNSEDPVSSPEASPHASSTTKLSQSIRKYGLHAGWGVAVILPLVLFFNGFVLLLPLLHGLGGYILHRDEGWEFYQPGKGGSRFVALSGVAWTFYAITIALQLANLLLNDRILVFTAFIAGFLSFSFMFASLFSFHGPNLQFSKNSSYYSKKNKRKRKSSTRESTEAAEAREEQKQEKGVFNSRLVRSVLMYNNGSGVSGLFWVLIAIQSALSLLASWFLLLIASQLSQNSSNKSNKIYLGGILMSFVCFVCTVPITHGLGGQWKNYNSNFNLFQPFVGGRDFILLQGLGWIVYSVNILIGFSLIFNINILYLLISSVLGTYSQLLITLSIFKFQNTTNKYILKNNNKYLIKICNILFGPKDNKDWYKLTRKSNLNSKKEYLKTEEKYVNKLEATGCNNITNKNYLIIGSGFVGKRIIKRLIERGETNIKIFDINKNNPFKNQPKYTNIEYIVGDVTNKTHITNALKDVDVIYCTFALIRFMDRLQHQIYISYKVNVIGTEILFNAIEETIQTTNRNINIIVTSSSHAVTDENSLPRFKRTEKTSPYVTQETSHNHYGWTKALGEQIALSKHNSCEGKLKVIVIRPCSGVFGGDDKFSIEQCLDLGVAPGVGSYCVMDWVFVENVVLGHLLAEEALENRSEEVGGEVFNISNEDPTTWIDFWHLVGDILEKQFKKSEGRKELRIDFCFVPMRLLWLLAYVSEGVQRLFKGRVSLGRDLDQLTPAALSTATMSYSYSSAKAKKYLNYEPIYNLDTSIQKSVEEYYDIKILNKSIY